MGHITGAVSDDIFGRIAAARSRTSIERICAEFRDSVGLDFFHIVSAMPRRGVSASVMLRGDWLYDDCALLPARLILGLADCDLPDPIVAHHLKGNFVPIRWDREFYDAHGCLGRWEILSSFGFERGLSVSNRAADGHVCIFIGGMNALTPDSYWEVASMLQLFTTYLAPVAKKFLSVLDDDVMLEDDSRRLTARELRLLAMAARGVSHQDMAKSEFMSRSAVEKALGSIREKLQVTTTAGAVLKAVHLEILSTAQLLEGL